MLITLVCIPFFVLLGLVFGILSPLLSIYPSCIRPWRKKWRTFVALSTKTSRDHEKLVRFGAEWVESIECIPKFRPLGRHLLVNYYKLGHTLAGLMILLLVTFMKLALFVPIWSAFFFMDDKKVSSKRKLKKQTTKSQVPVSAVETTPSFSRGGAYGDGPGEDLLGATQHTPIYQSQSSARGGAISDFLDDSEREHSGGGHDLYTASAYD